MWPKNHGSVCRHAVDIKKKGIPRKSGGSFLSLIYSMETAPIPTVTFFVTSGIIM